MANALNSAGKANASSRIAAGDVNKDAPWSFGTEDGDALLGANGDDWSNYGKWFLCVDADAPADTKAHYKYPFGKGGKVYRSALTAIRQRAGQQNDSAIFAAAGALLEKIDGSPEDKAMLVQRAYSAMETKDLNEDRRTFTGTASTPTPDRMEDIVVPEGAKFKLPMPLLWQHDAKAPVGWIEKVTVTKKGLSVQGRIAKDPLLPKLDEAWGYIRSGLVRGLSIGFKPIGRPEPIVGKDGFLYKSWEWLETSAVTIPANMEASIQTVKSCDEAQRSAAPGAVPVARPTTNKTGVPVKPQGVSSMKTIKEQIAAFEAKRAAAVARTTEIMSVSADEGRTLDDAEQQEYDDLMSEVKAVDAHITRLKDHEKLLVTTATGVTGDAGTTDAGSARARTGEQSTGRIVMGKSMLPKGTSFTRYAMALAATRGSRMEAIEYSKRWHDTTPEVELTLKAAVAAGDTATSGWASQLVYAENMASEFIELLRPMTIVGRIQGLRRVPFNIRMPSATAGSSASWVGETHPKPLSKMTFDSVTLAFNKISCIVVLTEELVRMSNPSAEALVRQDMLDAIAQFTDEQFIDPTVAVSGVHSPASVTNGATSSSMTGNTIANITTDVSAMFASFSEANINLNTGVWIMHPRSARYISMLRTTQDVFAFPGIDQNGGTFFGLPVITSNSVPRDTGDDTYIVLLNASDILLADEGGISLDVSREASLQMSDAPSDGAQSLVSLWQNNLIGLRAERYVTWKRRRDAAVRVLEDVSY